MILAALHALFLWVATLYASHIDAHPVPDPPAVTVGVDVPTGGHRPPPAPTGPAGPAAPAWSLPPDPVFPSWEPVTDSPMCPPGDVPPPGCWTE